MVSLSSARPTSGHSNGKSSAGGGPDRHESISTSVRVRTVPSCSRSPSPSAAKTSRGPALPPGSVCNRISKMSSRSASADNEALRSIGAERLGRRIEQGGCGKQPLDSFFQSGQTRQGNSHLVGGADGPGLATARRQDLQRLDTQPKGNLGLESSKQFIGCGRFVQFKFHDFTASFNADRQGQGEVHARLGSIPFAHAWRQPGAAKQPLQAAHHVQVADQAQCRLL